MDGKELFLMIEAISNEKNITKEDVLESLEEALAVATKKRSNIAVSYTHLTLPTILLV